MQEEALEEENSEAQEERIEKLNSLGMALAKTRSEAIHGRETSGIESVWEEDEEHYEGIDNANRGETGAWSSKPAGQAELGGGSRTGSTVFFNITRPYCDAASARIGDMLLPTEDKGWAIKATPIPTLVDISEGKFSPMMQSQIQQGSPDPQKEMQSMAAKAAEMIDVAAKAAEKAEKRIEDWHSEGQYNAEMRQIIEDSSKIGTGIMKGPVPERKTSVMYKEGALHTSEEIVPVSKRVDSWNCFPDPGCGNNIHKGQYHWERDDITPKDLSMLKGSPGYIDSQIDICLEEDPHKAVKDYSDRNDQRGLIKRESSSLFEIWYYYGRLKKEDIESAGCECEEGDEAIDVCVTMVNNRVIKAEPNYMDSGEFPYDYMTWQRRTDSPWGIGVARQIRTPQRVVNGAARNLMDNAGLAGGPMWIFQSGLVEPIDGRYELAPRKGWMASEDADIDDIRKAFSFIQIPMVQEDLQAIIQLGLKMAEDVTGLPMLLQGQQGNAPDTLGGTQIVNNNASTVLRRIARLWDDYVTEPHVRRYYRYLLQYGENDEEKGDFVVEARGSSALIERDAQSQSLLMLGQYTVNPMFGIDPKRWMEEHLKSQRLDPNNFKFDDERWEEILNNMAQPQQQDSSLQIAEMRAQIEQLKVQSKEQLEQMKLQFQAAENGKDRALEAGIANNEQQIKVMKLGDDKEMKGSGLKVDLAKTTMGLRTQKELSGTQAIAPKVEPRGRAKDGRSYEQ